MCAHAHTSVSVSLNFCVPGYGGRIMQWLALWPQIPRGTIGLLWHLNVESPCLLGYSTAILANDHGLKRHLGELKIATPLT